MTIIFFSKSQTRPSKSPSSQGSAGSFSGRGGAFSELFNLRAGVDDLRVTVNVFELLFPAAWEY